MKIKHPPSHYLKMMHVDSVTYHAPAATGLAHRNQDGIDFVGNSKISSF
jgi:hypothetical protein